MILRRIAKIRRLSLVAALLAAGFVVQTSFAVNGDPPASSCGNLQPVAGAGAAAAGRSVYPRLSDTSIRPVQFDLVGFIWWYQLLCGFRTQFTANLSDGTTATFGGDDPTGRTAPQDPAQPVPPSGAPVPANQPSRPALVVDEPEVPEELAPGDLTEDDRSLLIRVFGEDFPYYALGGECFVGLLGASLALAGIIEALKSRGRSVQ